MKFLTHILIIIGLLAPAVTRAQEPKPASKTSSEQDVEVLKIDTNLVTVPVIASSRTGGYIADLKKEEFKLTEDGVAQEIAFLASVDAPFYVVLMLDTSGSTKEKLPLIQRAAIDFLEQIRPNDKVKVISFDGVLRSWDDFTSDKTILRNAISKTRVGGGTRVYDAVQLALDSLRPIQQRKAIVLLTDGVDSYSNRASFESTVRDLDESGVIVYPIRYDTKVETQKMVLQQNADANVGRLSRVPNPGTLGNPPPPNANIRARLDNAYLLADDYLKKLADRSGGQLSRADTVASLPQAFAAIAGELRTQYLLGYYPTNKNDNPAYRKIQVKTSRKDIAIRARPGYRPKESGALNSARPQSEMTFPSIVATQTPQKPREEIAPVDVIRVTINLVQIDAVVTDKNDKVVPDLKLEDFEVYDNGKKQDVRFMEFSGVDTARRTEGEAPPALRKYLEPTGPGVSAKELKRVIAFVIDDLTMEVPDLPAVRKMLLTFVNTKMRDDDLVAIVRVVGGKGLLEQFTSDRQLLRRAIAQITFTVNPLSSSDAPGELLKIPQVTERTVADSAMVDETAERPELFSANDETVRYFRGLSSLSTANYVISALRSIPGRKDLVLVTAGIGMLDPSVTATAFDVTPMLNRLKDSATRAGVAVSTMDPRGLRASSAVKTFQDTPAKSASMEATPNFGRGDPGANSALGPPLAGGREHLGLNTISKATGGVSVTNSNDLESGLDKVLAHSNGYYTLAYTPSESFDRKFHKIEVKVKRAGTRVYNHEGYSAVDESAVSTPRTKEESIAAAARSPLARNEIDVTPNLGVKLNPGKPANVDIHVLIDAKKINFTEEGDRFKDSVDIVGFIFDQAGRNRGGFSETINLNLTSPEYQKALAEGLTYTAGTEVQPDYYQVRVVVREQGSGLVGSFSKYLEIPDLSKGKLAMSSLFLLATDAKGTKPIPLFASRILTRKQDLRYVMMIYNPKLKDGKPQLRSQLIISQGSKVLFQEPEQPVENVSNGPVTKMGQLALSGVAPGRYVLTLVVTDTLGDKKTSTQSRSVDFTVVN
jgi:VWFA-related protein